MGNPFGNDSICGWYTPMQTYDLCSGTQWGSMNIQMNANWDDLIARQNLYMAPAYSFNNFMPYGTNFSNNYLTDIRYTLGQLDWQNKTQGGNGLFDANGNFQMPWANGNNMWGGNWGWNPGGSSAGETSGSKVETAEDRKYQRNYNTLLSLAKQLKDYDGLVNSEKDGLETAIKNTKGTWKEKYENLKAEYDKVDKEVIKEFLATAHKLGTSKDIKGKTDANSFYERLQDSGYEYADSAVDSKISSLHENISKLKDNQGNIEADEILGALQGGKTYDILDVISSWNTRYKDGESDEKRVLSYIAKYYNEISDSEIKSTAKQKTIVPIVNSLIDKARSSKSGLNDKSKEVIDEAITAVTTALNNTSESIGSELTEAFDTLYLITRRAAMKQLTAQIQGYYGEIDSEVFNDELFESETIKDLEGEGFDSAAIEKANISAAKRREEKKEEPVNKEIDKKTVEEQLTELKKKEIEELSVKFKQGNNEYTVYRETKNTGDRNYQRLFIVKDGQLYELKNVKLDNGQFKKVKADVSTETVPAKASEIQSAYKAQNDKEVKAEETKKREEAEAEKKKEDEVKNNKEDVGKEVWSRLTSWTNSDDDIYIADAISDINKNNIYSFLKGVYQSDGARGHEGLIEKLDDDTWVSNGVTMEKKRNIIKAVLDKAKDLKLTNKTSYTELKKLYDEYTTGKKKDCKTFNKLNDFWSSTWLVGAIWGGWTNDNEMIDKWITNLYDEMKKTEEQEA